MAANQTRDTNDEFYRTAFERCPSGLLVIDRAGRIMAVNQEVETLFGYARAELLGQPVERLVPERFRDGHAHRRETYAQHPSARSMGAGRELTASHKDGREIPVEIGLSPVATPDGNFVLATIVDVSERRRLEERLRQAHKMEAVGTLASGIAHDFNNILLGIIGYTELAREVIADRPGAIADLDVVLDTARRGRDLVNRILFYTRKESLTHVPTDFGAQVREAIQLLRATFPANIEIREGIDPATPKVVADGNELHQIAMNLATNAAHAMIPRGGVLDVRVGPVTIDADVAEKHPGMHPGLHVRLSVTDTGGGIPPEVLGRIFDPFFTTKPPGEGTGLGLSVIHRIVHSLAGTIEVQSRVGEGTRFDVYIPAMPMDTPQPHFTEGVEFAKGHILLVDDEERLATLGRRVLEAAGYQVTAHTSSLQALEAFRSHPDHFDLLITDNTMPHLTGLELVERVRRTHPQFPILMVSGIGESMSVEELKARGVRRLLPKPYRSDDLKAAVEELVTERPGVAPPLA
jgi:PAS domain S-box-containing protein